MNIKIKKTGYLIFGTLKTRCSFGKSGIKLNKKEGDKATPKGKFSLGKLYYRKDRIKNLSSFLKKKIIKKNMGWCHNSKSKFYNKENIFSSTKNGERLHRKDYQYDLLIVINYNTNPNIQKKGSAIFLHLTKNFKPTNGCVAIKKKKFIKILKLINKKTKIIIG